MSSELYVNKVLHWNEQYLTQDKPSVEVYWKSITASERRNATTHCGPHGSYPLGPGCAHVSSAFTLGESNHGKPDMACIRNYARSHGCGTPPSQKAKEPWEREKFNRT